LFIAAVTHAYATVLKDVPIFALDFCCIHALDTNIFITFTAVPEKCLFIFCADLTAFLFVFR